MSTYRATFTLEEDVYTFLKEAGGRNKSHFVNTLIKKEQQKKLERDIAQANREEQSEEYQSLLAEWDSTLSDGLDTDV
jgi:hypothetical protein